MGNKTAMLDRHYSKVSPLLNAERHSEQDMLKRAQSKPKPATVQPSLAVSAFDILTTETLDHTELMTAPYVNPGGAVVTDRTALNTVAAKQGELITGDTLLHILNG